MNQEDHKALSELASVVDGKDGETIDGSEVVARARLTITRLTAEVAELRALNNRWIEAATKHYPTGWAMDPGNPELTIANVVEGASGINRKVIARLEEIAMGITTDDDQPCVICGDTYDVDHGKDDTGFCHQCATDTLSELLGMVVFPEAPQ